MSTASLTPSITSGSDFSDWLSPILVKELRQGLKTRMFVSVFVALQAIMIIVVGLQLLSMAGGSRNEAETFNFLFWIIIWVPLLILMPARGLVAVSSEVKANTLDLVQLTRLTAFRIVLGKWVALVSQTLLLVAAVLPYTVLRYFFGEVDVVMDLVIIANLLLGSLLLTAIAVMLSSMHMVVRVLVVVVGIPLSIALGSAINLMFVFNSGFSVFGSGITLPWWVWLFSTLGAFAMIYFVLEMAAGRIAPAAENHSGPRRATALATALLMPLIIWMTEGLEVIFLLNSFIPLWGWAAVEALCERTVTVPTLYRTFARKGFLGRLAGRVFYPGWASGLVFVLLLYLLLAGMASVIINEQGSLNAAEWGMGGILIFTALVLPVLVLRLFPRMKQPAWLYILVQGLFVLLFAVAVVVAEVPGLSRAGSIQTYAWLAVFPLSALLALLSQGFDADLLSVFLTVTIPVCALILATLLVMMMREFRVIRGLERQALQDSTTAKS